MNNIIQKIGNYTHCDRIVQKEGKREVSREVLHYNLDTIISVGYRVNSKKVFGFSKIDIVLLDGLI